MRPRVHPRPQHDVSIRCVTLVKAVFGTNFRRGISPPVWHPEQPKRSISMDPIIRDLKCAPAVFGAVSRVHAPRKG